MKRIGLATLLLCMAGLAGCFEWTQDSQGNLQSVGLPGVPVWQSSAPPPPAAPTTLGFTSDEAAKMSGPVLVMPTTGGPYRYRFYQTGQNHCVEDLEKLLAERANNTYANGPAPYCTNQPTMPPTKGNAFVF